LRCRLTVTDLEERTVPSSPATTAIPSGTVVFRAAPAQQNSQVSAADRAFLQDAVAGNIQEIALGSLAAFKGSSAGVRSFGQLLVVQHGQALLQVAPAARAAGITISNALTADQRQLINNFARLSGTEFDRQFVNFMVTDHQRDLAKYQTESQSGSDPATKAYAQSQIPVLRTHLAIAIRLQQGQSEQGPDAAFLRQAVSGNETEIALGALAAANSGNAGVTAFGRTLLTDHLSAFRQVAPVAFQEAVMVPSPLLSADAQSLRQLLGQSGTAFDRAFVNFMVTDHQNDIALYQSEIQNGKDPAAVAYAQAQLPVLQQHLQTALQLQQQFQQSGSGT